MSAFRWLVVCVYLPALALAPNFAQADSPSATKPATADSPPQVDFERDVRPILERRCFTCHSEREQLAGLRLDTREHLLKGGDSGKKLLGIRGPENELLRRVTNDNVEIRMPLEGEPLVPAEITVIRAWAEAGAEWPDPAAMPAKSAAPAPVDLGTWYDPLVLWLEPAILWFEPIQRDYGSLVLAVLAFIAVAGIIERYKRIAAADESWQTGVAAPWIAFCGWISTPVYVLGLILLLGWGAYLNDLVWQRNQAKLAAEVQSLRQQLAALNRHEPLDVAKRYLPPRPQHPKRLGGEYYRGNDERGEGLYNGGFYRTATLRIALCGDDKSPLALGDAVPPGKLYLKVEIEKARLATPTLFSKSLMANTFLSSHAAEEADVPDLAAEVVHFDNVVPGEKWVAYYPLAAPAGIEKEATLAGHVTLYNGPLQETKIDAKPHFGIVYDLRFKEGKVVAGSDLWMGSLYWWWPLLEVPSPGKVPLHEWFDFRPIPEIEESNTSDPKLLGVPEHLPNAGKPGDANAGKEAK